jgi:hypothetical protein
MPLPTYWTSFGFQVIPYSFTPWLWLVFCHDSLEFFALSLALGYKFTNDCGSEIGSIWLVQAQF